MIQLIMKGESESVQLSPFLIHTIFSFLPNEFEYPLFP